MNNLHGWAMNEYLPYGRFEWLENIDNFDIMSISDKSPIGYFLEVDLEYPEELHKLHNDLPLALEKRTVSNDMLSKYCKKIGDKYETKDGDVEKLLQNLGNKTNYVVHYRNLQLYLSLGMKLTIIHRVLKFKQSYWMKKYIDFNIKKRMNAANDNEKDFLKYTSRPTYIGCKKIGKYFAAIYEIKPVLILNKPIYIGFTLLDLSKWKMYDFHNNFIKKNFDAALLFTDTGSLTYEMKLKNVYEEFYKWKDLFDFSNYSKDSKFFNETNKKVIGKMKDEFDGVIVSEFIELNSKMYSIEKIDGKEHNTAKGVNIATEFDNFQEVLFNKKIIRQKM